MNLRFKILFVILASSVPMIAIAGIINYSHTESQISDDTLNHLNSIATIQEERVNDSIDRNLERLQSVTSRTQLRLSLDNYNHNPNPEDVEKINKIIHDAVTSIPDFESIAIFDSNGSVQFSSDTMKSYDFVPVDVIQKGFTQNHLDLINYGTEPKLLLSGPLILEGNTLATLLIVASPESIVSITDNYTGLGNTGESFLAKQDKDGNAVFITSLRFDTNAYLGRMISSVDQNVPIIRALSQLESNFVDTVDYRGIDVLSSSKYIEKTNWGLVVKIDKAEAFDTLEQIKILSISTVIIIALMSGFLSFLFSRNLSTPLLDLRKITKEIAKGNLKNKINTNGTDEISKLSQDIESMQCELEKHQKHIVKNARMYAIGELSSRLAHDLKNPLTVISTLTSLMERRNKNTLTDKDKQDFEQIQLAADRINHQINNVLDFIRNTPMKKEKILISKIINASLKSIIIPEKVIINLPQDDVEILCDPFKIEVVFVNLIKNAIQAINGQGIITIVVTKEKNCVDIDFIDSGSGIPDDVLPNIFEPLFTTKQEGTGLGLVSCKTIVEQHGGTINVQNNPTIFSVVLPLSE